MNGWKIYCFYLVGLCIAGVWIANQMTRNAALTHVEGISDTDQISKVDMAHEKILIAGVCRDTARAVPAIIENAEKLGNLFKDYAVLIYDNWDTSRRKT